MTYFFNNTNLGYVSEIVNDRRQTKYTVAHSGQQKEQPGYCINILVSVSGYFVYTLRHLDTITLDIAT